MAKKLESKSSASKPNPERIDRPFPRRTIEDALRVPRVLKDKNGGNPWSPTEIARAIGVGVKTGGFYYLTAASRDYGFTEGSSKTNEIRLIDLGRHAVYPDSPQSEKLSLLRALESIESFDGVLRHYKGLNLPEKQFLQNVLHQKFSIHPDVQDEFVEAIRKPRNRRGSAYE